MAVEAELDLGNTPVKLRWEEPFASSGADHKTQGVLPKGIYRGFIPVAQVGTFLLDLQPDAVTADSIAVYEATAQSAGVAGFAGGAAFAPTAGFNLTVFTSLTVTIDLTAVTKNVNRLLVLRAQYNEGNFPPSLALIEAIPEADLQPTDVVIARFLIPAAAPNLNTTTFVPGEDAISLTHAPVYTVGDGFESKGDFTGNRPNGAGVDTSGVIQTAISALFARNTLLGITGTVGGTIFVKRGVYQTAAPIIPNTGFRIIGEGRDATTVQVVVDAKIFDLNATSAIVGQIIEIAHLTLLSTVVAPANPLVRMNDSNRCYLRDVNLDFDDTTVAAIRLEGATHDCVLDELFRISGIVTGFGVHVLGTSHDNVIEGDRVRVRVDATATDNVVNTGSVALTAGRVVSQGNPSNILFGSLQPFLKGYIRGLEVLVNTGVVAGSGIDGDTVVIVPGDIEIDGYFYALAAATTIATTALPVVNGVNYIYAKRDTAVTTNNVLAFEASATVPAYDIARDYWVHTADVGAFPTRRYIGAVKSNPGGPLRARFQTKQGDRVIYSMDNALSTPSTGAFTSFSLTVAGGATSSPASLIGLPSMPLLRPHRTLAGGGSQLAQTMAVLLDIDVLSTVVTDERTFALVMSDPTNRIRTALAVTVNKSGAADPRFRFPMVMVPASTQTPLVVPTVEFGIVEFAPTVGSNRTYNFRVYERGYVDVR